METYEPDLMFGWHILFDFNEIPLANVAETLADYRSSNELNGSFAARKRRIKKGLKNLARGSGGARRVGSCV